MLLGDESEFQGKNHVLLVHSVILIGGFAAHSAMTSE
jgi:hypothetical protein